MKKTRKKTSKCLSDGGIEVGWEKLHSEALCLALPLDFASDTLYLWHCGSKYPYLS